MDFNNLNLTDMEDIRKQVPSNPDNWLYRDMSEDDRIFAKLVYLGINDTEWPECTDKEKKDWEKEHPQPEPEPEPEQ